MAIGDTCKFLLVKNVRTLASTSRCMIIYDNFIKAGQQKDTITPSLILATCYNSTRFCIRLVCLEVAHCWASQHVHRGDFHYRSETLHLWHVAITTPLVSPPQQLAFCGAGIAFWFVAYDYVTAVFIDISVFFFFLLIPLLLLWLLWVLCCLTVINAIADIAAIAIPGIAWAAAAAGAIAAATTHSTNASTASLLLPRPLL